MMHYKVMSMGSFTFMLEKTLTGDNESNESDRSINEHALYAHNTIQVRTQRSLHKTNLLMPCLNIWFNKHKSETYQKFKMKDQLC